MESKKLNLNTFLFQEDNGEANDKKVENKKPKKEDFSSDAKNEKGELWNLKIVSWNVDGMRAWLKVKFIQIYLH